MTDRQTDHAACADTSIAIGGIADVVLKRQKQNQITERSAEDIELA